MTQRRKFSEEFKREAVALTQQPGAVVSQIVSDIGIRANLLWRWRCEMATDKGPVFPRAGTSRDLEMAALKRELNKVKKTRIYRSK